MRKNKKWIVMAAISLAALGGTLTACGKGETTMETKTTVETETIIETETTMDTETAAAAKTSGGEKEKSPEAVYRKLSQKDAKARMDSGDDIIILDVRTPEEYEEKHIPGAILIPNEEIESEPLEQLSDLDQEILVYCRSGNRSAQAAKKMVEAGYTNVYDFGGINEWAYDTETGTGE